LALIAIVDPKRAKLLRDNEAPTAAKSKTDNELPRLIPNKAKEEPRRDTLLKSRGGSKLTKSNIVEGELKRVLPEVGRTEPPHAKDFNGKKLPVTPVS